MKSLLRFLPILPFFVSTEATFAQAPKAKAKVLEKFDFIDPKTVKLTDIKAKVVSTQDPDHRKALEMIGDFHKAESYPRVEKMFPAGTLNAAKYSGIRFYAKTENGSKMNVHISGAQPKPDGRPFDLNVYLTLTDLWREYTIPFSDFKYYQFKVWKDGAQKVYPGGEPLAEGDLAQIVRISFVFYIGGRGTDTTARALIDGLELIEK